MSNLDKEKKLLKANMGSIMVCVCGFVQEEIARSYIHETKTIGDFLQKIITDLQLKEKDGWCGLDLSEEQLNLLTLVSELYSRRYKSKYKTIETPSEILTFLRYLIEENFRKNELKWRMKKEQKTVG